MEVYHLLTTIMNQGPCRLENDRGQTDVYDGHGPTCSAANYSWNTIFHMSSEGEILITL
jgi:hypothetical protein